MANIRKTFNFRNGVQVDDDNLVVSSTGLVGIGTTVPTDSLDVRGSVKVSGLVTSNTIFSKNIAVTGITTLSRAVIGILSVTDSGIVTATSGIVTYFGDGGKLINLPASQWLDVDSGFGYTSIYAQGFVGVATSYPYYAFQVGGSGNLSSFADGVGISSNGNILATGIVTAQSFSGVGAGLTQLNASNISSGTLNNARLPSNISISGILTAATIVSTNVNINSGGVYIIGITTSTNGFVGDLRGNVTGNVTGTATTASSLTGTPNIVVGLVTANRINSNISNTGISTVTDRLYVGNAIGVGTTAPTSNFQIFRIGDASLRVTGTDETFINIGKSNTRSGRNAEFRLGNLADAYSGNTTLDIVNYDTGSINNYIHLGTAGISTGNFNWIYGQDQSALMTLTYDGRLGIGVTRPTNTFHVVGTSTITQDLFVGDDLFVRGDIDVYSRLTANELIVNASIDANLTGNVYANSGISTFFDIEVLNKIETQSLLIGDSTHDMLIGVGVATSPDFAVAPNFIGVGSSVRLQEVTINALEAPAVFKTVGIGTTRPRSAADFADAGKGYFQDSKRFFIPPRVSTPERNALDILTVDAEGAIVYNTSTNAHQAYDGTAWVDLGSGGGGSSYAEFSGIAGYAITAGISTISRGLTGSPNLVVGIVTGSQFIGDGSGLTGIIGSGSGIVVRDSGVTVGIAGTIDFGSNLTVSALSAGIVTVTASGGGGGGGESYWAASSSGIHTLSNVGVGTTNPQVSLQIERYGVKSGFGTFSATTGLATDVDTFTISSTDFKTAEYTLHIQHSTGIQAQKVLVMQNGTTAYSQEYAVMYHPNLIVSVGATVSGGACKLQVTPETGITGITTYRLVRETLF